MQKIARYMIALAVFVFFSLTTNAQLKMPVSRDSSMAQGMRQMQRALLLSDAQVQSLTTLTKDYEAGLKNGSFERKNAVLRKKQLADHYNDYRKGIKKILTADQWKQYEEIDAKRSAKLMEQMKAKKIKAVAGEIRN